METTDQFILRRKAEIDAEIERLKLERRQLVAAELVAAHEAAKRRDRSNQKKPETIKEQVVKILSDTPSGMTAKEILTQLNSRFDRNLKRESLSPQLSRLGAEGSIERDGKIWILPNFESALAQLGEHVKAKAINGASSSPPNTENPQEYHS